MMKLVPALALAASATAFAPSHHHSIAAQSRLSVSSIDNAPGNENAPANNIDSVGLDATATRRQDIPTSTAIPFLSTPKALVETDDMAGNFGFDPLGFCQSKENVLAYREAEIKHSRLAMLAAVGWPVSELLDRPIADALGLPSVLDEADRVPSVLNGGLGSVSPVWWGVCLGLSAAIDLHGVARARSDDPNYFAGNLGFDPLSLYPRDKAGQERMQLAEIKHGRTAMVGVTGFAIQEYVTKIGVVDETPLFFHPAGGML